MKQIGLAGGLPIKEQPGRLAHEIAKNKTEVLVKLVGAITKGYEVLGLSSSGPEKIKLTAEEAIKKILEVYPGAMVADIVKALEMASFGQIKLPEQLNTISAANIFGWYRVFRSEHGHLMSIPMTKAPTQMPEPTLQERKAIMLKAFEAFISDPVKNDLATDIYFQKLIDMGSWNPTSQDRIDAYKKQAERLTENIPLEFLKDSVKRKQSYEFADYWKNRNQDEPIQFQIWKDNPISKLASENAKRDLIREFLKTANKQELIETYKTYTS